MPWKWWNKVLERVVGKEYAEPPPCSYKWVNLWECHQQKTLLLMVSFWKKESGNSQNKFMAFFPLCQQTHIHRESPGSLASAILFFAATHMLLTRAKGLPLNGTISTVVIFVVRLQEDVHVDLPTQAEHVGVVTALRNLEQDLQSFLTVACTFSPERFIW